MVLNTADDRSIDLSLLYGWACNAQAPMDTPHLPCYGVRHRYRHAHMRGEHREAQAGVARPSFCGLSPSDAPLALVPPPRVPHHVLGGRGRLAERLVLVQVDEPVAVDVGKVEHVVADRPAEA